MPDYSSILNMAVRGLGNTHDAGAPGARVVWTLHETHGNMPSLIMRVRTHDAVTIGVPYQLGKTAAYPFGVTSAPATTAGQTNICVPTATHAAAGYCDVIVAGFVPDAVTDTNVTANANLEVTNGATVFVTDGTTAPVTDDSSFGFALEADTVAAADIWLFGTTAVIESG
jgi:hypothetical protein